MLNWCPRYAAKKPCYEQNSRLTSNLAPVARSLNCAFHLTNYALVQMYGSLTVQKWVVRVPGIFLI